MNATDFHAIFHAVVLAPPHSRLAVVLFETLESSNTVYFQPRLNELFSGDLHSSWIIYRAALLY